MSALGPRQVEPNAWIGWFTEAGRLLLRRPAPAVAYAFAVFALHWVGHMAAWGPVRTLLALLLSAVGLVIFIRLALALDYNRSVRPTFVLPANLDAALAVTVAAALFALHGALTPSIFGPMETSVAEAVEGLGVYDPRLATGAPADPPLAHTLLGPILVPAGTLGAAALGAAIGLLAFGQWFTLPMVVLHGAPPGECARMSVRAYPVNGLCLMTLPAPLLALIPVLMITGGWVGPVLLPYLGMVLYTAYRDVFLGRSANHPAGEPVLTDYEESMQRRPEEADEGEPFPGRSPGPDR